MHSTEAPHSAQYRPVRRVVCTAPDGGRLRLAGGAADGDSEGMNSLPCPPSPRLPLPPVLLRADADVPPAVPVLAWTHQTLAAGQPPQALPVHAGDVALLEAVDGRVWVTCDGWLEDYFLQPGQRLRFTGPGRLRASADGGAGAQWAWATVRATAAAAPARPEPRPIAAVPREAPAGRRGAVSAA